MKILVLIMVSLILVFQVNAFKISGYVFNDFNGDSILDNENLDDKVISLYDVDEFNEIILNTTNGYYEIDVKNRNYFVMQKLNDDEISTYPLFGFYHIVLNDDIKDKNFGNFKLGKISGHVFNKEGNPLENIKVILSNNFTYLTNENGYYEFTNLEQGNYNININNNFINNITINSGVISENNNFVLENYAKKVVYEENSWIEKILLKVI